MFAAFVEFEVRERVRNAHRDAERYGRRYGAREPRRRRTWWHREPKVQAAPTHTRAVPAE